MTRRRITPVALAILLGVAATLAAMTLGYARVMRGLAGVSAEVGVVRKENAEALTEVVALKQELAALRSQVEEDVRGLRFAPMAWAETPSGLEPAPAARGIDKAELAFLRAFRQPLVSRAEYASIGMHREALGHALAEDFAEDARLLADRQLTARQQLVAYAMLRVNGSMPTYEVRDKLPTRFDDLLLGTSGNCSDYAVRLMIVLESIGVRAAFISSATPALPGHVFVDAFDPVEGRSYLLDANFNVMVAGERGGRDSFIAQWLKAAPTDRAKLASEVRIVTFPVYFRFVDPGAGGYQENALTADAINELRQDREARWRRWLAEDAGAVQAWWAKAPRHRPQTLAELQRNRVIDLPAGFDLSGPLGKVARTSAGLDS